MCGCGQQQARARRMTCYQVLCASRLAVPAAAASELGLSGSGEAWGHGVPPRHCPAREELIRDGRGAEEVSRGAVVKQGPCGSHAIARRARYRWPAGSTRGTGGDGSR